MKIKLDDDGNFVITPENWEEEQVYKLFVKSVWDGETAVLFNTWDNKPAYRMDSSGGSMRYVGDLVNKETIE